MSPGPDVLKNYVRNLQMFEIGQSVCHCKPFQLSLLFTVKARSLPRVEHIKGALLRYAQALLTNIRLGRKGIASDKHPSLSGIFINCFITLGQSASTIKHYGSVMYGFHSKLVCMSKQRKVTDNRKGTSLLQNMSIFP
jgi:hypothetical protein